MEAAWAEAGEDAERDLPMGWQGRRGGAGASSSQDKHHGQPRTSSGSQLRCLCHQASWELAGTFVRTVGESSPALGTAAGFWQQQTEALLKTSSERLPGREGAGYIPRCSVILCPDPDKLIQMVRPQDGGIAGQVFKVVHDDGHEQVEHLGEGEKGREKGK